MDHEIKVVALAKEKSRFCAAATDMALLEIIQHGLPLTPHPYAAIGEQLGITEGEVISRLHSLQQQGVIKRLGVVVRHRKLGYRANAMVVWDIPDERVAEMGRCMGRFEFVTLCYRRPRRMPDWPYNLFCMIHGCDREAVLQHVARLAAHCGLDAESYQVLFSKRCFKQRGAVYHNSDTGTPSVPGAHGDGRNKASRL